MHKSYTYNLETFKKRKVTCMPVKKRKVTCITCLYNLDIWLDEWLIYKVRRTSYIHELRRTN